MTSPSEATILRFDGPMDWVEGDNLCFTVLSHHLDPYGKDRFGSSFVGVSGLLQIGVDLNTAKVVLKQH